MNEELAELTKDDDDGPEWVPIVAEIRKCLTLAVVVIGAIWAYRGINQFEGKQKAADAELAEQRSRNAMKPNLMGSVTHTSSASINSVRELIVNLKLSNMGLVDAEIEDISLEVYKGEPKHEMDIALNAAQELAWKLSGEVPPRTTVLSDSLLELASYLALDNTDRIRTKELIGLNPHGRLFCISYPSPDLAWGKLESKTVQLKGDLIIRPNVTFDLQQDFVLTQHPDNLNRTWYNFRFAVRTADDTAPNKRRIDYFCYMVAAEPLPQEVITESGAKVDVDIYPWESPFIPNEVSDENP